MKKNGIALAIILIILVLTLVACGENDFDTCEHDVIIDEAVSATCTEMGLTEGAHCSKCGEVLLAQTEVPALGHTAADAVKENEIAPTCTTAGSYDSVVYCSVCDVEISRETKSVDALDHNIVNHNAQAPTCTEVGWEAYETCSRCDHTTYVEIPATGHNHVPAVTAPTCTERGYTTYTCHCGDTYIADEVPATGHSPLDAVKEKEIAPDCTTKGSYDSVVYCSVCNNELSRETIPVDALDHNIVNHNAQAPTCTEIGWNAYETCSRCDHKTYAEIPALGHDKVGHEAKAPTCTEIGWNAYETCSRCDYTTYVEIPATGHNHVPAVTAPTCTERGYTTYSCHCGDTYIADEVPATGHNFENNEYCLICSAEYYTEGLQFSLCKDEYTVTGIITSASDVTIPSTYQGHPVTEIAANAFYECTSLTSIVIPASVTTIDYNAFQYCSGLTSVTFGENSQLTTIGAGAFCDCSSLTSITIPDSVTTIGNIAFHGCTSLTSIVIPDSMTTIGKSVFKYCSNLTSVTFGENSQLTTIGDFAFYDCRSLTSIVIPASVTSIGELAFSGSNVTDVYYKGDIAGWCGISFGDASANPMVYADNLYIDGKLVEGELVIPDSVTTIPIFAFRGCAVTSVTFGNESQLTAIDSHAFAFCKSLTSVTIPDGVTSIGNNAFSSCDNLTNVTFGNDSQLLEIGSLAFAFCYSLTSISIPNKVTNIGVEAFRYCYSIKTIFNYSSLDIVAGETTHGYIAEYADHIYDMTGDATLTEDEDGFVIYTKGNVCELVEYKGDATDVVIPDGITAINSSAFYDNDAIGMVFIPDGVTSIGNNAFFSCDYLTSVYYNGDVAGWCGITFGDSSANPVYYADNLYIDGKLVEGELVIPDSVTTIPECAFRCQAITSVVIPDSVTTIGTDAFRDCTSLTSVTFGENSKLTTIGDYAFYYCRSLTSIVIPDSVITIGEGAFIDCTSLTSVTFGENSQLTTIGWYAFEDCTSLTSVTIPDSVTTIRGYAFRDCTSLTSITVDENNPNYKSIDGNLYSKDGKTLIQYAVGKSNTTFEIPSGVTTIDAYAFYNCTSLTSIVIPASVTSIGEGAFMYCSSLTSITIPASVTTIGSWAFKGCTSLTSITIPEGVTTIGSYAFEGCSGLTSIVIPDSVTTIGWYAFKGCTSLTYNVYDNGKYLGNESNPYLVLGEATSTSITSCEINENCKVICGYAFYNCASLTSITIPASVTSIGEGAFMFCSSLTDVYYEGTEEQWNAILIGAVNTELTNATIHYNYVADEN